MVIRGGRPLYPAGDSGGRGWTRAAGEFVLVLAIAALVVLLPAVATSAELPHVSEHELKATFLYNFVKFTTWPPEELGKNSDRFVIGVLGKDPFGNGLDRLVEGESLNNKMVVVKRFARPEEAVGSQALFISSSEEANLSTILRALEGKSILTISEIDNFAQRGGIINLKKENNRFVFEINLDTAKHAGLRLNAQLLKLAKIVVRNRQ